MAADSYLFTSESVSEGHPDKVCDRISDEIVDLHMARDPASRVAVETLVTTGCIIIAGETGHPDRQTAPIPPAELEACARQAVRDIGYEQKNFHWERARVCVLVHGQSEDIARGVNARGNREEGAGDQGLMFGYACRDTAALMPAPIHYCHRILRALKCARAKGAADGLGPDAKCQLTLCYEDNTPVGVHAAVVSSQHAEGMSQDEVRSLVEPIVLEALPEGWMSKHTRFLVNPTGKFVSGGPDADVGLTGRKIIVDTYGGAAPHGGGAFSGKDPSKVDRSAAYAARYLAKNVVAADLAARCTIQLSYAIGEAVPLSVYVDLHGTGRVDEARLVAVLRKTMDHLTPRGIRDHLELDRPIYARTAAYGHFGRKPDDDGGFSWERTDLAAVLRAELG